MGKVIKSVAVILTLALVLGTFGLGGCASCGSGERLGAPFDHIIPSCQNNESAPNLWFENTRMGKFHAENKIIGHYERACKGEGVKFWMDIMVFATDDDARIYIQKQSENSYFTWTGNDLPYLVKHQPDQFVVFGIDSEPTFVEGDDDEYGALTEGVLFRVGRYVGDYSITRSFPSVYTYYEWGEVHGVGFACWKDLYSAVDFTIYQLCVELQ